MPLDRKRVFAIYSEMLELDGPERDAALSGLCAGEPELEAEVRALLSAQADNTFALSAPVEEIRNDYWRSVADDDPDAGEDLSGEHIGRWLLEQKIGRGGLATVYRATRADGEFTQTAAFKVMRRGLDSEDLIRRFRTERQILAGLAHPGIAGILDGGTLPDGRPFLVLEFVDGEDIVSWIDGRNPALDARLELIEQVAEALHHAHQRLVVHRDVKPSNVMVTGDGTVRLLDFGIARLLEAEDSPVAARLTRTGVRLLTPAYGTPEQYAGAPVTTASDVYQLGLLMAEVLSGNRPQQAPEEAAIPDLTGLGDRDLRAIIEKATRPEPEARYPSILSLKDDLNRFRRKEPVMARAGTWRYRTGKFIRRRPFLVPGLMVGAAVIAAYVVTLTIYSRELAREQAIATTSQSFLIRLFESPNPRAPADPERGRRITVLEALDIGRASIEADLAGQPAVEAALSRTLSAVYAALNQYEPAIGMRQRALELERSLHGPASSQALESMRALTRLQAAAGDLTAADSLAREQLALARESAESETEVGLAEYAAGEQAIRSGQAGEGAELMESAISGLLEEQGVAASVDTDALRALLSETAVGVDPSAQILATEALIEQSIDADSPTALVLHAQIAASLAEVGDVKAAEARYLKLIPKSENVLGPLHPDTLSIRNNLAVLYSGEGRYTEAEAVQSALLPAVREVHGEQSLSTANTLQNLATAISRQGRYGEALELHEQALALYEALLPDGHPRTALPLVSMALALLQMDQPAAAELRAASALGRLDGRTDSIRPAAIARCLVGTARIRQGQADGEALIEESRRTLAGSALAAPYEALCLPGGASAWRFHTDFPLFFSATTEKEEQKMKTSTLILIATLIPATALADPGSQRQSQDQSESASQNAQAAYVQPGPSRSVSEFVGRTITAARLQAEEEVQYETRRQVNKAFNRLIGR